ncbi:MAG: S9 family peptidase [Bryobacterales bacterium]|nr:S9 family peptidase [Bryobacterales bacterium]
MLWRAPIATLVAFLSVLPACLADSDELGQRLKRIYDSPSFRTKRFGPARWIRGGAAYTTLENAPGSGGAKEIVQYETATGQRSILVSHKQLTPPKATKALTVDDYHWSKDAGLLLIYTESRKVWRTNSRGDYWVLNRTSGNLKKLGGDAPPSSLSFAKFSPDGSRAAYVRANNLYVEDLATGSIRALTTDGSATLVNAASDWVYEEELNVRDGFRWSPDGQSLAFWQFDSTGVEQFALIDNTTSLYPKINYIPYPKAGTKNSAVRVGVISAEGGAPRWIAVPGDPREHYIFKVEWLDHAPGLVIGQLNRLQNKATIFSADPGSGAVKAIFEDRDAAWVDVQHRGGELSGFDWLNQGRNLLWISERDGWSHAYSAPVDGGAPVLLTPQASDVLSLQAVDPQSRWIYYTASPANATQRYLYRSSADQPGPPVRLSPDQQPGTHVYDIAPNCQWAFHTYSRFDRPPVIDLVSLPGHKPIRVLEDNAVLRANAASLVDPPVEFLQLTLDNGAVLDGWLLKPRVFDPSKKYPLLVYVYGEPASVTVVDAWAGNRGLFHRAIAEEGYLVASFDNRGTPAPKGRAWRKSIYGSVGVLSSQDQAEAVIALARLRSYVDVSRVGVWGWSGGGSNTLNLLFRSPDLFRAGVSVAPVPDQRLYDTIYQERYMGLPEENADGYRSGSPIHFAEGLRGKLLLIHGSGDDNVHFQGTEKLVNRLIELGKPFDFMEYPNRSHAIAEGPGTTLHIHRLIARYIKEHVPAGPRAGAWSAGR